eukprot:maker-scaffold5_size1054832-snap-gene-5.10 protein:Tk04037 transcript:maker-scaffold5_size1054832-snap-gene-5.10-mRNA-1 annotation:"bursicon-beta"
MAFNLDMGQQMALFLCLISIVAAFENHPDDDKSYTSSCETLPSEIHITKDETDENSLVIRTCEENIAVNKCEGACRSTLMPSAVNPLGFQKDCKCCRESSYRERSITLGSCYDPDGRRLTSPEQSTMKVTLNEPMDCRCHECGKKM